MSCLAQELQDEIEKLVNKRPASVVKAVNADAKVFLDALATMVANNEKVEESKPTVDENTKKETGIPKRVLKAIKRNKNIEFLEENVNKELSDHLRENNYEYNLETKRWEFNIPFATSPGTELNKVIITDKEYKGLKAYNEAFRQKYPEIFEDGEHFKFNPATGIITVIPVTENSAVNKEMYEVYTAHEIKHALTYKWLKDNSNKDSVKYLGKALKRAVDDMNNIPDEEMTERLGLLKDRLEYANKSGMNGVAELVAILSSEPNIRKEFIKHFPQDARNRLTKILDAVLAYLGIGTGKVIETVDAIVANGRIEDITTDEFMGVYKGIAERNRERQGDTYWQTAIMSPKKKNKASKVSQKRAKRTTGMVSELNKYKPRDIGKNNTKVVIRSVDGNTLNVVYVNKEGKEGAKEYPLPFNRVKLDQKDVATIVAKYKPLGAARRATFSKDLDKKLQNILKKLYPKIKLEYTEQEILHGEGLLNQEAVNNTVNLGLKVVEALTELGTAKPSKHGGASQPVLSTIRLKNEAGIRKKLAAKDVSKEQIDFVFEYMKQNDIGEINSKELAERVLRGLGTSVEISTTIYEKITPAEEKPFIDSIEEVAELTGFPQMVREEAIQEWVEKNGKSEYKVEIEEFLRHELGLPYATYSNIIKKVNAPRTDKKYRKKRVETSNTNYYKNLNVPGGTNYQEKEIATPSIVAPKKGHANFATDKGIGWYRVDDSATQDGTLRVLEMQSDMFQKMKRANLSAKDAEKVNSLIKELEDAEHYLKVKSGLESASKHTIERASKAVEEAENALRKFNNTSEKDVNKSSLQLLNTDNKWVKFFIQSIVQDSQKKGYKNIRFPAGETVAKIEGYTEEHGSEAIKKFYQVRVRNTLIKTYSKKNIQTVTDGHGNQWFELTLDSKRDSNTIMLQKDGKNQIKGQADIEAKTVLINSLLQSQDTLPHEYAHHYIAMFRDAPIVQEAIKKWGSEEKLVQAIGEQVVKQEGEVYGWWQKFTKWLQGKFNKLDNKTKEELRNLLTDSFLTAEDLSRVDSKPKSTSKKKDTPPKEPRVEKDVHGNIDKMRALLAEIHDLGGKKESKEHLEYLDGLLGTMKPEFFEKMTTYINNKAKETHGTIKNTYINIDISDKPYSMRNQQSEAEVYVHEVVHSMVMFALRGDTRESIKLKVQLEHVMDTAASKLTWEDFMPIESIDKKAEEVTAKEMYEYIFTGENRIDEFISHALTNPIVMEKLKGINVKEDEKAVSLLDRITELFHTAMEMLTGNYSFKDRHKNTFDQTMNIAFKLAESNNRALKERNDKINIARRLWDLWQDLNTVIADNVEKVWDNYIDKGDYKAPPKERGWEKAKWMAGAITRMLTNSHYRKALELILSSIGFKATGDIQSILRDFFKGDKLSQDIDMLALLSDKIDSAKVSWVSTIMDLVHTGFKKKLTNEEEEALTSVVIDTDLSSIYKKFGRKDLAQILDSDAELDRRLSRVRHKLKENDSDNYFWNSRQASGLGYYMATGEAHTAQLFNAENIARGLMTGNWRKPNWKSVALIDELATLTALKYTPRKDKAVVRELLRTNRAGIENVIKIHEDFKKDSKEKLFQNGRTNIIKGYSKGTFDSSIDMKVAPIEEKANMEAMGYTLKATLPKNKRDVINKEMGMYIANSFEISNWHRGATRLTRIGSKGTTLSEAAAQNDVTKSEVEYIRTQIENDSMRIANAMTKKDFDESTLQHNMAPVLDSDGEITDFRYIMTKKHKKELLKQDTRVSTVLSHSFAHTIDKEGSRDQNEAVLNHIITDMKENYTHGNLIGKNLKEYVIITKESSDPKIEELYKILPPVFKKAIYEDKHKEIAVRADLLHTYFGYRHISLANNKYIQAITPEVMRKLIKVAEHMWMEFIKISKVDILIKMPIVVIGNIVSNFMYAIMTGTNPVELIGDYIESSREVSRYFKRHTELLALQVAKKTGNIEKRDLRRIEILEAQLADSPIHELSELGIYQSIVEDMEHVELDSTNKIKKEVDEILGKAPKLVKDGINLLYLTENTSYFKFMNAVLTKSDLVARDIENRKLKRIQQKQADGKMPLPKWYVMKGREHLKSYKYKKTTKRLTGKEREAFMKEADKVRHETVLNAFINYNKPSGPIEEYLNKMGAIMFTKYVKRVQRVISETGVKNPMNVGAILLGEEIFGDVESIYDQSIFTRSWFNLGLSAGDMIPGTSPFDRIMEVMEPPLVQLLKDPIR